MLTQISRYLAASPRAFAWSCLAVWALYWPTLNAAAGSPIPWWGFLPLGFLGGWLIQRLVVKMYGYPVKPW